MEKGKAKINLPTKKAAKPIVVLMTTATVIKGYKKYSKTIKKASKSKSTSKSVRKFVPVTCLKKSQCRKSS